ncbi:hypothetical protein PO124_20805 [Bacillus licheniformis]|nr:hypothetical protein [Bacillus licheniformis]
MTAGDIIRVLEGPISPVEVLEMRSRQSANCGSRFATLSRKCWTPRRLKTWPAIQRASKKRICLHLRSRCNGRMERIYLDHAATSPTDPG